MTSKPTPKTPPDKRPAGWELLEDTYPQTPASRSQFKRVTAMRAAKLAKKASPK